MDFHPSRLLGFGSPLYSVASHILPYLPATQDMLPIAKKTSTNQHKHSNNDQGNCTDVSSRFEKMGKIGHGTYGVVYKAKDLTTKDFVALKRVTMHHEASDGFPITSLREIQTLRELHVHNHPSIINLFEVAVSKR